ncbi:MAG TPA: histidine ammonia-lyase [Streptosporangiaceae bacterium]|nr:histidine ammonia-lyase [Streptosporangiaceae bacterium]
MRTVIVNGDALTVDDVVDVANGTARAELAPEVQARMEFSRAVVAEAIQGDRPVYGVNTGFGALADTAVGVDDLNKLQRAIIVSHAAASGEPLDDRAVRAILLLRARTLAAGLSGVREDLPRRLLDLLDRGLLPVIPGKGSVGASGDLAQLAHLAQPLIGEGRLRAPGDAPRGRPAAEVLAEHGIEPLVLGPKEGLSLVNGTEPMQALLAFSISDAGLLVHAADVACAMSIEALLGTDRPYDPRVQVIRPHPGQLDSAANLRALLTGSGLMASHRDSRHAVQDAYCLRCAPQVHGAVRDVLSYARRVIDTELGAVVDNPVIVPDGEVMTTGNFHGEPLAFAADMLGMAVSELASISERRVDRMLDPAFSRGLPPFLAPDAGTNSGFMLAQYTAASLVSENKVLAHPSSVDTIPTSGKQEDHVSMGWTGVRKLREIVQNVRTCLAIEILCAAQGVGMRSDIAAPSAPISAVHSLIRDNVPRMDIDREVSEQIAAIDELLPEICQTASTHCGGLL